MQTESREGTVGIIPPSRCHPPLVGSHYFVSALVLVVGAIPPPPPSSPRWLSRWLPSLSLFDGSSWERQEKAEEGGKGSGGGGGGATQKWCGVCALSSVRTLLGKASKIWEVGRKSVGSRQEVGKNSCLNRYRTRSMLFMCFFHCLEQKRK
jgi:hypothetical protein